MYSYGVLSAHILLIPVVEMVLMCSVLLMKMEATRWPRPSNWYLGRRGQQGGTEGGREGREGEMEGGKMEGVRSQDVQLTHRYPSFAPELCHSSYVFIRARSRHSQDGRVRFTQTVVLVDSQYPPGHVVRVQTLYKRIA